MTLTPVVLCIDVEPDERRTPRDGQENWTGVAPTAALLEQWRARFAEVTGAPVHFSWFWRADPQIEATERDAAYALLRYRDVFDTTTAAGDAHGVHAHTWRRQPSSSDWIQDNADSSWVDRCIDLSVDTFERVTGNPCELSGMGDRALDTVAYQRLADHKVRVDLSVEPGEPWWAHESIGPGPDFTHAPTRPYRPRRSDTARPSRTRRGPLLLPLSASVAEAGNDAPRLRTIYPWLPEAADRACELLDRDAPYLAFAVRSDISIRPDLAPVFETLLARLAGHRRARSLRFVTPLVALRMLRADRRRRRTVGNFRPPR